MHLSSQVAASLLVSPCLALHAEYYIGVVSPVPYEKVPRLRLREIIPADGAHELLGLLVRLARTRWPPTRQWRT